MANYAERWFSVTDLLDSPKAPPAALEAALEHDPPAVTLSVRHGATVLNADQARRLLLAYVNGEYVGLERSFVNAAALSFTPEEFASELAALRPNWRLIAASLPYLETGPALHYLARFGLRAHTVAQHAFWAGHMLPASVLRTQATAEDSDPELVRFWKMVSPEVDPAERAQALAADLGELKYFSSDIYLYGMVSALRDADVVRETIDIVKNRDLSAHPLWGLREAVYQFPVPQVRDEISELALRFLASTSTDSFDSHTFFGIAYNYGLNEEVRQAMRPLARQSRDIRQPDWMPTSGEPGLTHIGELVCKGIRIEVAPDFAEFRRIAPEKRLYLDRRWPGHHRAVVTLADSLLVRTRPDLAPIRVSFENLLPVFGDLLVSASLAEFRVSDPEERHTLARAVVQAGGPVLSTDPEESSMVSDTDLDELLDELVLRLGNDQSRWRSFYALLSQGLNPSEAVVVAA